MLQPSCSHWPHSQLPCGKRLEVVECIPTSVYFPTSTTSICVRKVRPLLALRMGGSTRVFPPGWKKELRKNTHGAGTRTEKKVLRGFEPRSLDSESRVLTVTPRGQLQGKGFQVQKPEYFARPCPTTLADDTWLRDARG